MGIKFHFTKKKEKQEKEITPVKREKNKRAAILVLSDNKKQHYEEVLKNTNLNYGFVRNGKSWHLELDKNSIEKFMNQDIGQKCEEYHFQKMEEERRKNAPLRPEDVRFEPVVKLVRKVLEKAEYDEAYIQEMLQFYSSDTCRIWMLRSKNPEKSFADALTVNGVPNAIYDALEEKYYLLNLCQNGIFIFPESSVSSLAALDEMMQDLQKEILEEDGFAAGQIFYYDGLNFGNAPEKEESVEKPEIDVREYTEFCAVLLRFREELRYV